MSKKLYALTDDTVMRLERYARAEATVASNYAADDLVPLDRDAAVERMARALYLERLGWGGYSELTWETESEDLREMFGQDARAALEALTNQEDE